MNRLIKVLMVPLLVIALVGTTIYLGLLRPGAISSAVGTVVSQDAGREALATSFVDMILEDETAIIGVLIRKNRDQVEQIVADVLDQPEQRAQLGSTAQQWADAMLHGDPMVELDPRPLFRPIYAAVNELLPLLNLGEDDLADLQPVVLGEDDPLPDLRILRNIVWGAMAMWFLWLPLAFALRRRLGRRGSRTVGVQLLSIGIGMALVVFAAPRLIAGRAGDQQAQELARTLLTSVSMTGIWLAIASAVVGIFLLVRIRERSGESVAPSEGATDRE